VNRNAVYDHWTPDWSTEKRNERNRPIVLCSCACGRTQMWIMVTDLNAARRRMCKACVVDKQRAKCSPPGGPVWRRA
jgi:hypothetical protein